MAQREIRIPERPGESLNRSKRVSFTYNGKTLQAYDGDTVASVMAAEGRSIFGRSFKYHRPRGLLCVSGHCPNCMMNVDGEPNVRSCVTPVRQGMVVRDQNAWPSLEHDLGSMIDKFSFALPVGFYYKTFHHPKWLWPLARKFIRRAAGYGTISKDDNRSVDGYEHVHKHVDIIVVGGGPSGLSAALEASRFGFRVLLVDDQPQLGGHLRQKFSVLENGPEEFSGLRGFEVSSKLVSEVSAAPNVEVLTNATCFAVYEGNLLGISQGRRLIKVRAKRIIVSSGCFERPFGFTNNDLPGIFLGSGVQRLVNLYSVRPGDRAVVATNNSRGYEVASDLVEAGIGVVAIVDARSQNEIFQGSNTPPHYKRLEKKGVRLLPSGILLEALGGKKVNGVVVGRFDQNEIHTSSTTTTTLNCDLVSVSIGFEPANDLLYQGGCEIAFDEQLSEPTPLGAAGDVYPAGEVTGIHDLEINMLQGKLAAVQAVLSMVAAGDPPALLETPQAIAKRGPEESGSLVAQYSGKLESLVREYRMRRHPSLLVTTPVEKEKKIICVCEDITEKDINNAIDEGFDDIETLKRYSTFSMGPCQGKMCSLACTAIHAGATGLSMGQTKRTTARPPYQPLPFALLYGPPHRPVKYSAMHYKHVELGANLMNMGEWKRPHDYGSVDEEYRAIRERVGLIDVSTLGRFEVRGGGAGQFLDMVYGHVYSKLKKCKARYALLMNDAGVVIDDGIIASLGENDYFVTSSTGNAELVEEWLKWWESQGSTPDVSITNMTSGLAAINVAGPNARDVLSKLVDVSLSQENFPYMTCSRAKIAGEIPVILLRIGFVGEVGWEVHFPAEYGDYLWDLLMDTGKQYGIRAVGVEAMRVLSLEKGHIWPTIDTDSASDALETNLGWAVKFEKDDFVGKHSLLETKAKGFKNKLVGVEVYDGSAVENGDIIIDSGKVVGRVTNAKFSPARQKYVGLAWVPAKLSTEGSTFNVTHEGRPVRVKVVSGAFYDPDGTRMKS